MPKSVAALPRLGRRRHRVYRITAPSNTGRHREAAHPLDSHALRQALSSCRLLVAMGSLLPERGGVGSRDRPRLTCRSWIH